MLSMSQVETSAPSDRKLSTIWRPIPLAPAVMNIPYIGWLAAGWATLLGQNVGSTVGSEVGSVFNDC